MRLRRLTGGLRRATAGFGLGRPSDGEVIRRLAVDAARLAISDEDARKQLSEQLRNYPIDAQHDAVAGLGRSGEGSWYLSDRARRLLEAVVIGQAVSPIEPDHADLYTREEELGRMPMLEAYRVLMTLVPELGGLRDEAETGSRSLHPEGKDEGDETHPSLGRARAIRRAAKELVGPKSKHPDPLVRSSLALGIVQRYLYAASGYTELGVGEMSYFEAPTSASGSIGGSRSIEGDSEFEG